jgi:RNA polymerase sigma factor (sigma-70 family)
MEMSRRGRGHVFPAGGQPAAGAVGVVYVRASTFQDDSTYQGDSLSEAFRSHRAELVRLAAFILSDRGAGEDVVQDVFVRLCQRHQATGYRVTGSQPTDGRVVDGDVLPYLRAAVVNGCRTTLRRRRLIRRHAEDDSPCPPLTAEEAAMLSADRTRVLVALAALPPRRRAVLVLRFYLELSEAEIAATLGISPGTVKSTAARALAALADALKEMP